MDIDAFNLGITSGLTAWAVVAVIGFIKRAANSLV